MCVCVSAMCTKAFPKKNTKINKQMKENYKILLSSFSLASFLFKYLNSAYKIHSYVAWRGVCARV